MDELELLLDEIFENDPSAETAYLVLSKLKDKTRPEFITQRCRRALKAHPNHVGLRTLIAEAYTESGLLAKASEELEKLSATLGGMFGVYFKLARAFKEKGRDKEAVQLLMTYLAVRPEDEEALSLLRSIQPSEPEEPASAVETVEQEVSPAPEPTREPESYPVDEEEEEAEVEASFTEIATATLAELYFNQGELNSAIETYKKVVARNPGDEPAMARLRELEAMHEKETGPVLEEETEPLPDKANEAPLEDEAELVGDIVEVDSEKQKTERLINTLEGWLSRIREAKATV